MAGSKEEMQKQVVPPLSFACVSPLVYRSAHPMPVNFAFLERLSLRTIVYLADDEYLPANQAWAAKHNIKVVHFRMPVCKEPFVDNDLACVVGALKVVMDPANLPVLCHSNKGKHRVGVLIGCLRKHQRISLAAIYDEYGRFSGGKGEADLEFIEQYKLEYLDTVEEAKNG